jgi:ring-1,2-phenylacetyl-CoA epoxidase subunit PaaC
MWMNRLATLSNDSRSRLLAALDEAWPDALGIFEPLEGESEIVAKGILPASLADLQAEWFIQIAPYFDNLNLPFPAEQDASSAYKTTLQPVYGGRRGEHTQEFAELWEEMTSVYQLDPEAVW